LADHPEIKYKKFTESKNCNQRSCQILVKFYLAQFCDFFSTTKGWEAIFSAYFGETYNCDLICTPLCVKYCVPAFKKMAHIPQLDKNKIQSFSWEFWHNLLQIVDGGGLEIRKNLNQF